MTNDWHDCDCNTVSVVAADVCCIDVVVAVAPAEEMDRMGGSDPGNCYYFGDGYGTCFAVSVSYETWLGVVGDVVAVVADTDPVTEADSCDSEFENYHNNDCCEYYCCCYSYFDGPYK